MSYFSAAQEEREQERTSAFRPREGGMDASTATRSQGHSSVLVNGQYRIAKRLGGGSFGDIFLGVGQNGEQVAVKFEKHSTRCPQLRHEYKVYRELQNCPGFGRVYFYGTHNNFNAMVMDLFGPSLEDLFTKCGRRFSLKTVLRVADQLLERMDTMHSRHLIHRDVKPANFVVGPGSGCQTIFCIDFGLSTRYRHPRTLQHIPYRRGRSLTGTPRYASVNNHLGVEQSRRDDLESIGFVLVYFLKGSLPWQGLKARNAKQKYKIIMERKQAISIQQLCQGLPQQFAEYLAYCRSLKFEAKPNVPYLQGLLRDLFKVQGHTSSATTEWDWEKFESPYVSGVGDNTAGETRPTTGCAIVPTVHDKVPTAGDNNDISHGGEPSIGISRHDKAGTATALCSKWGARKHTSSDTSNNRNDLETPPCSRDYPVAAAATGLDRPRAMTVWGRSTRGGGAGSITRPSAPRGEKLADPHRLLQRLQHGQTDGGARGGGHLRAGAHTVRSSKTVERNNSRG